MGKWASPISDPRLTKIKLAQSPAELELKRLTTRESAMKLAQSPAESELKRLAIQSSKAQLSPEKKVEKQRIAFELAP